MSAVVVFEWSFTPPDYFEVPIEIVRNDYTLTIAHGKAEARLDSPAYEANPAIRQTLHEGLNDRCLGVQLLTHRAYELSRSTMTRVHPDGRKDVFLEAEHEAPRDRSRSQRELNISHLALTGDPAAWPSPQPQARGVSGERERWRFAGHQPSVWRLSRERVLPSSTPAPLRAFAGRRREL
jgi:hypothetical protein